MLNKNVPKNLKHSENNFLSPFNKKNEEHFHRKSTSNKGELNYINLNNNNNNNFNKSNSKKKLEFSNFQLNSTNNNDLVKTAQNLTNFLNTKTFVNNQINDFIRRNSNVSISNSSLAKILENSNPAYAIANIALTSPHTVSRQKSKKKKINNNNLTINSPKNNDRKSFTFLDLIKQENHQNLRNSMILTQPNFLNNNKEKIIQKLKQTSHDNILYKNTFSSNSHSNKKLTSSNNLNFKKNLYSSFILPSNNITKNLIKELNKNSDNSYFHSLENDLFSLNNNINNNNVLKKKDIQLSIIIIVINYTKILILFHRKSKNSEAKKIASIIKAKIANSKEKKLKVLRIKIKIIILLIILLFLAKI